jgi:hypothetical protein
MKLTETVYESVNWIHLAQDTVQWRPVVNKEMNLLAPYKAGNLLTR